MGFTTCETHPALAGRVKRAPENKSVKNFFKIFGGDVATEVPRFGFSALIHLNDQQVCTLRACGLAAAAQRSVIQLLETCQISATTRGYLRDSDIE